RMACACPEARMSIRQQASMAASGMTSPCRSRSRAQKRPGEVELPGTLLACGVDFTAGQGDGCDLTSLHDVTAQVIGEVAVADIAALISSDGKELVALREGVVVDRLRLRVKQFSRLTGSELRLLQELPAPSWDQT